MICPSCGKEIAPDSKYCSKCGIKISDWPLSSASNAAKRQSSQAHRQITRSNKKQPPKWPLVVLPILIIALLGGFAYYFLYNGVSVTSDSATSYSAAAPTVTVTPTATPATSQKVTTNNTTSSQFYELTTVEIAYNEAHSLDTEKQSDGKVKYYNRKFNDGITFTISDSEFNYITLRNYSVSDGALYNAWTRTAANIVSNWKDEKSYESTVISTTIGTIPGETRIERLERLSKFCDLFQPKIDDIQLIETLHDMGIISNLKKAGDDVQYDIEDVNAAASNLEISERMLGYVIAYLSGKDSFFGGTVTFSGNSVHVSFHKYE